MKIILKMKEGKRLITRPIASSPFIRKVRKSPLPKCYSTSNELQFDETVDPVVYLSHFNTEMEVYQVKEPIRCRLLATTLHYGAY